VFQPFASLSVLASVGLVKAAAGGKAQRHNETVFWPVPPVTRVF
jgi:hypothetical protein